MTTLYPAAVNSTTAVDALYTVDWAAVASSIGGINNGCKTPSRSKRVPTADECRARWTHFEMPGVVSLHETWTKEEDISIIEQVGKYGDRAWVKIADEMAKATGRRAGAGRTPIACFKRFQAALSQGLVSLSRWSETEDAILRQAVEVICAKHSERQDGQQRLRSISIMITVCFVTLPVEVSSPNPWGDILQLIFCALRRRAFSSLPCRHACRYHVAKSKCSSFSLKNHNASGCHYLELTIVPFSSRYNDQPAACSTPRSEDGLQDIFGIRTTSM